jgi:hypothetical protein
MFTMKNDLAEAAVVSSTGSPDAVSSSNSNGLNVRIFNQSIDSNHSRDNPQWHSLSSMRSVQTKPAVDDVAIHPTTLPIAATILDVSVLEKYFIQLLAMKLGDSTEMFKRYHGWLMALINALTILYTQGQTPATRMLGLQFSSNHRELLRLRLFIYAIVSSFSPLFIEKLRELYQRHVDYSQSISYVHFHSSILNDADGIHEYDDENDDIDEVIDEVARMRQMKVLQMCIIMYDKIVPVLRLATLLACWTRHLANADPIMACTGFYYRYHTEPPKLHVEYAYRRWLFQKGIETARILLGGLAVVSVWKRDQQRLQSMLYRCMYSCIPSSCRFLFFHPIPVNQCPLCRSQPILIPYVTDCCSHAYCYACLTSLLMNTRNSALMPHCRVCGKLIQYARPRSIGPRLTQQ